MVDCTTSSGTVFGVRVASSASSKSAVQCFQALLVEDNKDRIGKSFSRDNVIPDLGRGSIVSGGEQGPGTIVQFHRSNALASPSFVALARLTR